MQRFQLDRPIMVKRWRMEWEKHGRDFGKCHCGAGMGTMRKHRPYESCSCLMCELQRIVKRRDRRRERYTKREQIRASQTMTEQEYVDATNLAKIRSALAVLGHVVPDENTQEVKQAIQLLYKSQDRLEKIVKTDPS